jgi:hypothetical protein
VTAAPAFDSHREVAENLARTTQERDDWDSFHKVMYDAGASTRTKRSAS